MSRPAPPPERRDRARGFVGGFDSRDLAWERGGSLGAAFDHKTLSYDSGSGDATELVRAAGGLDAELTGEARYLDLLILSGSVEIDGRPLSDLCYAGLAGGRAHRLRTDAGFEALLLATHDTSPDTDPVDLRVSAWQSSVEQLPSPLPPGLLAKPLRVNDRGGLLFCSGSLMRWMPEGRWERHPHFEEQFYLAGEFTQKERLRDGAVTLRYGPGGYSFRPAGIWHLGPGSGTDTFCIRIVRTPERLVNEYAGEPGGYPEHYAW